MPPFEEWIQVSNRLLVSEYCLTLDDVGFEHSDLERSWSEGELPTEFVNRVALKFDLTSRTEIWFS